MCESKDYKAYIDCTGKYININFTMKITLWASFKRGPGVQLYVLFLSSRSWTIWMYIRHKDGLNYTNKLFECLCAMNLPVFSTGQDSYVSVWN